MCFISLVVLSGGENTGYKGNSVLTGKRSDALSPTWHFVVASGWGPEPRILVTWNLLSSINLHLYGAIPWKKLGILLGT